MFSELIIPRMTVDMIINFLSSFWPLITAIVIFSIFILTMDLLWEFVKKHDRMIYGEKRMFLRRIGERRSHIRIAYDNMFLENKAHDRRSIDFDRRRA